MTKPRVPNTRAKAAGPPPKAGVNTASPSARASQARPLAPLARDGTRRAPSQQAVREAQLPFVRHKADDPPAEAAKGDDDAMSDPQTVMPGKPAPT